MPFPPQSEVHILLLQLHNSLIQLHAWLAWQEPGTVVEILDTLPIVQRALLMGAVEFNSWNFIHFTNQATFFANWGAYFSSWFFLLFNPSLILGRILFPPQRAGILPRSSLGPRLSPEGWDHCRFLLLKETTEAWYFFIEQVKGRMLGERWHWHRDLFHGDLIKQIIFYGHTETRNFDYVFHSSGLHSSLRINKPLLHTSCSIG